MIVASTGEVCFDGLCVAPHTPVQAILAGAVKTLANPLAVKTRKLPIQGWRHNMFLGSTESDCGHFDVEVVTGPEDRVEGAFLSHHHAFYDVHTPNDGERRVFHDGVIASNLLGQREFPWGHVFCRVDNQANRDWLVLIYNPFSQVPLHARDVYRRLFAHEIPPAD